MMKICFLDSEIFLQEFNNIKTMLLYADAATQSSKVDR